MDLQALVPNILQSYVYQSLPSDGATIRILELHAGGVDDPLSCSMRAVSLNSDPVFETISYFWGDVMPCNVVLLDGVEVAIPANAAAALTRIRCRATNRQVWIDAVCIDQGNIAGKAEQVRLMHKIYLNAQHNLIYLGPVRDTDVRAWRSLNAVLQDMRIEVGSIANYHAATETDTLGRHPPSRQPFRFPVDGASLMSFFARPWFRRLWVAQESMLARSSTCFFGNFETSLTNLTDAAVWLTHKSWALKCLLGPGPHPWVLLNNLSLWHNYRGQPNFQKGINMQWLYLLQRTMHVSDQRDRVFAMHGVTEYSMHQCTAMPPELKVDYTKEAHHVLRDATRLGLWEDNNLFLLRHVSHRADDDIQHGEMVSWVPRWDGTEMWPREPWDPLPAAQASLGRPFDRSALRFGQDANVLDIQGVYVDEIVGHITMDDRFYDRTDPERTKRCLSWLTECIALAIAASSSRGSLPEEDPVEVVARVICACGQDAELLSTKTQLGPILRQALDHLSGREVIETNVVDAYLYRMSDTCYYRRVFRTKTGLLGVGPQLLATGDNVVVLLGGDVPYVLRPWRDGMYRLLGECYVHGIMQGEVFERERTPSGATQLQWYALR